MTKVKKAAKSGKQESFTENELHALQRILAAPYYSRKKMKETFCSQFGRKMAELEVYMKQNSRRMAAINDLPNTSMIKVAETLSQPPAPRENITELRLPFKSIRVEGGVLVIGIILPE